MRTLVTFEADFPNDEVLGSDQSIEQPPGRNIAVSLRNSLSVQAMHTSEVESHEFYGWTFDVTCPGSSVQLLLQFPGPWLLCFLQRRKITGLFRRTVFLESDFFFVISEAAKTLQGDMRFSDVRWYFKKDYESGQFGIFSRMP